MKHIGVCFPFLLYIYIDVITDAIYRYIKKNNNNFLSFLLELASVTNQTHKVRKESDQGTEGLRRPVAVMLTLDSHAMEEAVKQEEGHKGWRKQTEKPCSKLPPSSSVSLLVP